MRLRPFILLAQTALAFALFMMAVLHSGRPDRERAFPTGALRIGVDASYPPFAVDDDGALRGLEIDLAAAIAREIGLPAQFRNIGFYSLYDALISGEVDALVASLPIDATRTDDARYTSAYFNNGLVLASAGDSSALAVENLGGKRIAVEYASSADSLLHAWLADGIALQRMPYELPGYALDALRLGQADSALTDNLTYRLYQRERSGWLSTSQFITHDPYAIAVRRDNHDAWQLIEAALERLRAGGALARLIALWA
ncbi:MAG: ABC transporter substrate-binding protein [Chloroflexi bacterium]|nr:ABC transporter substrate-binding protein [Chloroflexota bacterium]MCY4247955.1 ABC transporter substrate-binding protein [Chloroflexota bacterium]